MRRTFKLAIAALAALAVTGCEESKPGKVYERPLAEVRSALADTEVPMYLFGSESPDIETLTADPAKVQWKVVLDGSEVVRFTATTVAEGPQATRVAVSVEGAKSSKFGDVEQRLTAKPTIRTVYQTTMTEAVDARLMNRPYDVTATYPAIVAAGRNVFQ